MPKRFLKPGLTTSENWNPLKWMTQSFYVRLITLVDDYGRYDGRIPILRSYAFPLRPDVTDKLVEEMCAELATNGLATFYIAGDKTVIQLSKWVETPRSEPRFPEFDSNCKQLYADANKCSLTSSSSSSSSTTNGAPRGGVVGLSELVVPESLRTPAFLDKWGKWVQFRKTLKKVKHWPALFQEQLEWIGGYPEPVAIGILGTSLRNGYLGLFEPKVSSGTVKPSAEAAQELAEIDRKIFEVTEDRGTGRRIVKTGMERTLRELKDRRKQLETQIAKSK